MAEPNVNVNTSSNSTLLVAGPTGQFAMLAITRYNVIAAGATNVSIQDTLGNVYDGPMSITPAGSGLVNPGQEGSDLFVLPKGAGIVLVQDGSAQLGGSLGYRTIMR